ncbi:hypothetical protein M9H77_25899 [Catharanthus roseus]|uniref:Uncharacterized protein n=1 Tax=Catharanthus roseus TaxID=4058 RepID=A0ACC0AC74_CATRO|nr:hypothetical protein M9H77_25899 [Catharanthus roseus]
MANDDMQKMFETLNEGWKNEQVETVSTNTIKNGKGGSSSTIVPSNIGSLNEGKKERSAINGIQNGEYIKRAMHLPNSSRLVMIERRKDKGSCFGHVYGLMNITYSDEKS